MAAKAQIVCRHRIPRAGDQTSSVDGAFEGGGEDNAANPEETDGTVDGEAAIPPIGALKTLELPPRPHRRSRLRGAESRGTGKKARHHFGKPT